MIRTDQTETVPCDECDGTGKVPHRFTCKGCDHSHEGAADCDFCEGAGTRTYPIWEPDPNCSYCQAGVAHPLWWGLTQIRVERGGIKFHG